jgi:predicted small integral membrane protein
MWEWIHPIFGVFLGVGILFGIILTLYILEKTKILKTYPRRGFLHIPTSPGIRFFIGMLVLFYICLFALMLIPSFPIIVPFSIGAILLIIIFIWG